MKQDIQIAKQICENRDDCINCPYDDNCILLVKKDTQKEKASGRVLIAFLVCIIIASVFTFLLLEATKTVNI